MGDKNPKKMKKKKKAVEKTVAQPTSVSEINSAKKANK